MGRVPPRCDLSGETHASDPLTGQQRSGQERVDAVGACFGLKPWLLKLWRRSANTRPGGDVFFFFQAMRAVAEH